MFIGSVRQVVSRIDCKTFLNPFHLSSSFLRINGWSFMGGFFLIPFLLSSGKFWIFCFCIAETFSVAEIRFTPSTNGNPGIVIFLNWFFFLFLNLFYMSVFLSSFSLLLQGVTEPMLYIGMLFSMFAWHVEDHYFYRYFFFRLWLCYCHLMIVDN